MGTQRSLFRIYHPAFGQGEAYLGLTDAGIQVIETTISANTVGAVDVVLHSFKASVKFMGGLEKHTTSYGIMVFESSASDNSAIRISARMWSGTAATAYAVPVRLFVAVQ